MKQYPSIVYQTQQGIKSLGIDATLEETYQELVKQNFINPNGEPTEWALKQGYIGVQYNYPQGKEQLEDAIEDQDTQAVFGRMKKNNFIPNKKDDDYYIEAKPLIKAIKGALRDNAISEIGKPKWRKVLAELEESLKNS